MRNRVADFIGKHQLLSREGLHIVALSGGADSVALLLLLHQLGYRVEAAHCNFRLRGEESDRDERFAKALCGKHGIPFHVIHFDTKEYAALHRVSIEMAARELRYRYFGQLREDIGAETVCVAHHRDDAVETLLLNLIRGTGIHGLTGIRPKNGFIVRPLLCVSRQETEEFLHSIGQDYVTDSTNRVDDVSRNKIRLNILPLMREINPSVAESIDRTAHYLREAEVVYNDAMDSLMEGLVVRDETSSSESVNILQLQQLPSAEAFLHEWLAPKGFNPSQIRQLSDNLDGVSGRELLSATHVLITDRETLVVESLQAPLKPMKVPEEGRYRYAKDLLFEVMSDTNVSISKTTDCATLDREKVKFPLTIRPITAGDKFQPFGMKGQKLLSDFLTDRKLTVLEKRRQLVVADATGTILWVVGLRIDDRYQVTESTVSVLRIRTVNQ